MWVGGVCFRRATMGSWRSFFVPSLTWMPVEAEMLAIPVLSVQQPVTSRGVRMRYRWRRWLRLRELRVGGDALDLREGEPAYSVWRACAAPSVVQGVAMVRQMGISCSLWRCDWWRGTSPGIRPLSSGWSRWWDVPRLKRRWGHAPDVSKALEESWIRFVAIGIEVGPGQRTALAWH